jgi:hypothetical protein
MLHLVFQVAATGVAFIVAQQRMLPHDLSYLPLSIVLDAQSCLLALWIARGRSAWTMKAFAVIAFLGLSAGVRWVAGGMFVPADHLWFFTYMVGTPIVPLVGLVASEAMLHQWRGANRDELTRERMTYSLSDLLTLMVACGVATALLVTFPPNPSEFEYTYGFGDYFLYLSISSAFVVSACLIIFRASLAREFQFRTVILVLGLTLIVSRLVAWALGIRANPLWASYTLGPCLTASVVALVLAVHRTAVTWPVCATER